LALTVMVVFLMKQTPSRDLVFADNSGILQNDRKTIINKDGLVREVFLPDGSLICLFPGSRVAFSACFKSKKREVYLDGEAFFEVSHDAHRPFLVYTNALTTRVLGTSFFIKAYKKQKEIVVSVQTGQVSVYENIDHDSGSKPRQEVILSPNQKVVTIQVINAHLKNL
jgi:transmembrane sensor